MISNMCGVMHPSGTSLGDPIEVGAALAVFARSSRHQPLAMAASKSWMGHAEPAAGLAGLLLAKTAVTAQQILPIMHLHSINPYVASSLEQSNGSAAMLPKQPSAHASVAMYKPWTCAVSAFAFQGTNAHVLVEADGNFTRSGLAAPPVWQRVRHYVVPELSLLASKVTSARHEAVFHASLGATQLAFLWDHHVLGKQIFPGKWNESNCLK